MDVLAKTMCYLAKPKVVLRKRKTQNKQYTYWQMLLTDSKYHSSLNEEDPHSRLCFSIAATGHCSLFAASTEHSTNNKTLTTANCCSYIHIFCTVTTIIIESTVVVQASSTLTVIVHNITSYILFRGYPKK